MPTAFISYSRRDKDFVQRLHAALTARDYDVWVDWNDIPPSARWLDEIRAGITGADCVVYVISPESVASDVCTRELELAAEEHKRIVPVVHRDPDGAVVPEIAAALNWVFLRAEDDFHAGVQTLAAALETDLDHVRRHTRLGVAAGGWQASGREGSQLLRGSELAAAEAWLVAAGEQRPAPTQLQREYLLASRQAATRRQRAIIGAVSLALLVAVALGVVALVQRANAIHERDVATSRFLDAAAQANGTTDPELGVLLAVRAAETAPGSKTEEALREALARSNLVRTFTFAGATAPGDAVWSPDGTRLLVTSPLRSAAIYSPGAGTRALPLANAPAGPGQSGWDASGDHVVIGGAHPAVYAAASGRLVARLPGVATFAALSSDGTRAVTTGLDGTANVFDVASGRVLATFHPAYRGGVTCLAWAPNDAAIAQCDAESLNSSNDGAALDLWNPRTGRLLHSDHSAEFIGSVAFSPDGRRYVYTTTSPATANPGAPGTFVYDTGSGAKVVSFPGAASAATFGPDGDELAYATLAGDLAHVYYFPDNLDVALPGATAAINSVAFSHAGTEVVTTSDDGTARVYDAVNGVRLEQLADGTATGPMLSASFGLDDTAIATTSADGEARLWSSPEPKSSRQLELSGGLAPAASVGFTHSGNRIVEAGLGTDAPAGEGAVLDPGDLAVVARFAAPAGFGFAGAATSLDGRLVAALAFRGVGTGIVDEEAATFDAASGRQLATMGATTGPPSPLNLSPQGDLLVTTQADGDAQEWDPRSGRRLAALPGHGTVAATAYSPDGSLLAIVHEPAPPATLTRANEGDFGPVVIDLWDSRTGRLLRRIEGPGLVPAILGSKLLVPIAIAFSANGKALALVGADRDVHGWGTRSGAPIQPLPLPGGNQFGVSVAFSPNDQLIAAGTGAGADVWNIHVPSAPLFELQQADPSQYNDVNGGVHVGFSPNSQVLVTSGDDALEAWEVSSGLKLFDAFASRGDLDPSATAFVATAGGRLSVYPCELCGGLPALLATARRELTRGFTPQESLTYLGSS